jgi:hypothetical protein
MRLRCGRCRRTWIDVEVGVCSACGLALGTEPAPAPNAALSGAFDIDLVEDLNADFARVSTPPPPDDGDGPGWRPTSITGVTGEDAIKHHGIPERVAGAVAPPGSLRPFEAYLLGVINGASDVDSVVAASGLGPHEAAVALQSLKEKKLIRFQPATGVRAVPAPIEGLLPPPAPFGSPLSDSSLPVAQGVPLALRDESPDHQVALAVAARDQGDLARAREHARLAWLTQPEHRQAALLLDALENPRHAKTRARLLHDLGNQAHTAGDYARAVTLYRNALGEFEPSAVIHHKLAMVLVLAGVSYEEAEHHLLRAIQLQPNHVVYGNNLARLREMKAAAGGG